MKVRWALLSVWQHLAGRRIFQPVNSLLFQLGLRGLGFMNSQSPAVSGEAHFVRRILPRLIDTDAPVVLDVGAHAGVYADLVMRRFPRATLHAIEPHPGSFRVLDAAARGRFRTHHTGFSDTEGEADLFDYPDSASSHASLHRTAFESFHGRRAVPVKIRLTTLDRFTREHGIDAIDLLKLDTEGHECHVLRGARDLIRAGAIRIVQIEFTQLNVLTGCRMLDLLDLLEGYTLHRLLPHGMVKLGPYSPLICELPAYQNLIAVRRDAGATTP